MVNRIMVKYTVGSVQYSYISAWPDYWKTTADHLFHTDQYTLLGKHRDPPEGKHSKDISHNTENKLANTDLKSYSHR